MNANRVRYKRLRQEYRVATPSLTYFMEHRQEMLKQYDVIITPDDGHRVGEARYYVQLNRYALSNNDLLLLADSGNLCYGGTTYGRTLVVYTD